MSVCEWRQWDEKWSETDLQTDLAGQELAPVKCNNSRRGGFCECLLWVSPWRRRETNNPSIQYQRKLSANLCTQPKSQSKAIDSNKPEICCFALGT